MSKKKREISKPEPIYHRIREILESARANVARTVNTTQVVSNWLVGREIVEEEQQGKRRAGYGEALLKTLVKQLQSDGFKGYSLQSLKYIRQFYFTYPDLLDSSGISHAARDKLDSEIGHAVRGQLPEGKSGQKQHAARGESEILYVSRRESWEPGQLHPNLSWTHYRTLLRVDKPEARAFYEIEATENHWTARELERQINSLLYERLALSRDKKGVKNLAKKGQEIQTPADVFKDPFVIEFLGLPESPKLSETDLETALIDNLQAFLLELGKGFAFVARQQRLTLEGDHFYIDLVFYHTVLKCFVLIDLKTGKLTHQDLGQLQLYVNYYDQEMRTEGDQPTLGLILCSDKNDTVIKYTLGPDQKKQIFASRYQQCLPTEAELRSTVESARRSMLPKRRKGGDE